MSGVRYIGLRILFNKDLVDHKCMGEKRCGVLAIGRWRERCVCSSVNYNLA